VERAPNTTVTGRPFARDVVEAVWSKAKPPVPKSPAPTYRFDRYGALIARFAYGNPRSPFGWEIDHILPVRRGGTDRLENLQPLRWMTNREKGDRYPWRGRRRADGPAPPRRTSAAPRPHPPQASP